ncbi:MAG TPA: hypothetical protein DCW68_01540 [Rhodospirillaceae bacterium]|nr:MAG: hypothetical protein A2018_04505 [Alphaproteobacteria bacterium GWF2_58_20]HAU28781.1 hypothetical protein [Rhodospirillaceae bacterium]
MSLATSLRSIRLSASPLDAVEQMAESNAWPCERRESDELFIRLAGRWCEYHAYVTWQEEYGSIQFSCLTDIEISALRHQEANDSLAYINARLWLGHFEETGDENLLAFRHTILMRNFSTSAVEQLEEIIEIALAECERYYPAFQLVMLGRKAVHEAVNAALIDPIGEA